MNGGVNGNAPARSHGRHQFIANLLDPGVIDHADATIFYPLTQLGNAGRDLCRRIPEGVQGFGAPCPQHHLIASFDHAARHRPALAAQANKSQCAHR
jgi:hypothetical protein